MQAAVRAIWPCDRHLAMNGWYGYLAHSGRDSGLVEETQAAWGDRYQLADASYQRRVT